MFSCQTRRKNQSGFSLIEVLVIVSIIAFLASIVFLAIRVSMVKARNNTTVSNVRTAIEALILYHQDHGVYPPTRNPETEGLECWGPSATSCGQAKFYGTPYTVYGSDDLVNIMSEYINSPPETGVNTGLASNHPIYSRQVVDPPSPIGGCYADGRNCGWLIWPHEGQIPDGLCPLMPGGNGYVSGPGLLMSDTSGHWFCSEWFPE